MCRSVLAIFSLTTLFLVFIFSFQLSEATVRCYKGFSGDGRPFKDRLCQTDYCLKTTDREGGSTYGCDDFTPFCQRNECVKTSKQEEKCCCNTGYCNSTNNIQYSIFVLIIAILLVPRF